MAREWPDRVWLAGYADLITLVASPEEAVANAAVPMEYVRAEVALREMRERIERLEREADQRASITSDLPQSARDDEEMRRAGLAEALGCLPTPQPADQQEGEHRG